MKKLMLIIAFLAWGLACFIGGIIYAHFLSCKQQPVYHETISIVGMGDSGYTRVWEGKIYGSKN